MSTPYAPPALVLPNGTRLEVVPAGGDRESWVQLTSLEGLDGVGIREATTPAADSDGEVLGPTRLEARLLAIEVQIIGRDRLDLAYREQALRQAFARTDGLWPLRVENRWPGAPALEAMVRVSQPWRCGARTGRPNRVSQGQVVLKAPDPVLYETTWRTATAYPPPSDGGIEFPVEFPVEFGGSAYGGATITAGGDAVTWPLLTIYGPITDPVVANFTTGQEVALVGSINSGNTLHIDPRRRLAYLNDDPTASVYHWTDGARTSWWGLIPGPNAIGITGDDTTDETRLGLTWRDAWL